MIRFFLVVAFLCTTNLASAQAIYDRDARFHPVLAPVDRGMVVSQDYLASLVGAEILAMGGNAVDAAVATGFALAVTFPQAGNLGGGGFMLVHLAEENKTFALDYRENGPRVLFCRDVHSARWLSGYRKQAFWNQFDRCSGHGCRIASGTGKMG